MRATAQDREAAALMGIDINRTIAVAFLLGGALAGAAGMVALYYNNSARFQMGFRYGLFAFTAAVLGGIGNLNGAVLGGFIIGLVWSLSDGYMKEFISWLGRAMDPVRHLRRAGHHDGLQAERSARRAHDGEGVDMASGVLRAPSRIPMASRSGNSAASPATTCSWSIGVILLALYPFFDTFCWSDSGRRA